MNKILAAILSFLLWIMPWWMGLFDLRERVAFDKDATMNRIADCIKARDVETLESMMRPWLKENVPDLTAKLGEFYDAIEGDVISVGRGGESTSRSQGIYCEELNFGIYTSEQTHPNYYLWISYDVSNSKSKNEVGISRIYLQTKKYGDPENVVLFSMRASD